MGIIKTYGIIKLHTGKYAVCSDIDLDKKTRYVHERLAYKRADFALVKAENFIKACHNFNPEFEFKNMGLIN